MKRRRRTRFFLVNPPALLLKVYAYEAILYRHANTHRMASKKKEELHSVVSQFVLHAESEMVEWFAKMEITQALMLDDESMKEYLDIFLGLTLPKTEEILMNLDALAKKLGVSPRVLDFAALEKEQIKELIIAAKKHIRQDVKKRYREYSSWDWDQWSLYFSDYETEEWRIVAMRAIEHLRLTKDSFWWQPRFSQIFGEQSVNLSWQEGEKWYDTIKPDGDDKEPWME